MADKFYNRANPRSSFRQIALRCGDAALCDHTTPPNKEEIIVQRCCYACLWCFFMLRMTRKSIKWTWVEPLEMNVNIEQELNFVVDNRLLFLDAQEAKKVSERTVVQ